MKQIRTIRFMSAADVQDLRPTSKDAIISMRNPDAMLFLPEGFGAVLEVIVSDVDDRHIPLWRRLAGDLVWNIGLRGLEPNILNHQRVNWPAVPFSRLEAENILDFLSALPKKVTNLIVQCEDGKSRSRAGAEVLAEKLLGGESAAVGDRIDPANARIKRILKEHLAKRGGRK